MTLITGEERRRRWSDERRAQIFTAVDEPGAVIADVARRADVCTSLVYKWRREARKAASAPGLARVIVEDSPSGRPSLPPPLPPQHVSEPGVIVVQIKDALTRTGMNAPSALITATLKALRA